jgi:two-component system chemotaxis response regulator CheY
MLRILVVDDSASARSLVSSYLAPFGELDQASNGREALELYDGAFSEHRPYDLVVMDLMMPEMDGFTAMQAIRRRENERGLSEDARTKIVTLSSRSEPEPMLTAQLECGADMFITKPFEKEVLMEAVVNLGLALNPPEN